MKKSIPFAMVAACCLLSFVSWAYCEPILLENVDDQEYEKRAASPGGMWFGPRLGKRSKDIAPLQRMLIEAMAANADYGGGAKRRLTPRLGRDSSEQEKMAATSRVVDFIPRLGRELTPAMLKALLFYDSDPRISNLYARAVGDDRGTTLTETKVPPFAPRLGRELTLGDIYSIPRVERSTEADSTKSSKSS